MQVEKCVLVVDDSPLIRRQMELVLSAAGIASVSAESGREALQLLQQGRSIDLVLCDINMPDMSGLEVLRQAKEKGIMARTHFVVVTTEVKMSLMQQAKSLGAKGWLTKPLDADTLNALIRRYLRD